jgi:hypothetical protein
MSIRGAFLGSRARFMSTPWREIVARLRGDCGPFAIGHAPLPAENSAQARRDRQPFDAGDGMTRCDSAQIGRLSKGRG